VADALAAPRRGAGADRPAPGPRRSGRARRRPLPRRRPGRTRSRAHTPRPRSCSRGPWSCWRPCPSRTTATSSELTARMLRGLSVSSMHGYARPHGRGRPPAGRGARRPARAPGGAARADRALGLLADQRRLTTARGVLDQLTAMVQQEPAFSGFEPEVAGRARASSTSTRAASGRPRSTWSGRWPASPPALPSNGLPGLAAAQRPGGGRGHRARLRERRPRRAGGSRALGARGAPAGRGDRAPRAARPASPSSRPTPPGSVASSATTTPRGNSAPRSSPSARSTATPTGRRSASSTWPPPSPEANRIAPSSSKRSRPCG
jgi:hypothetical protein